VPFSSQSVSKKCNIFAQPKTKPKMNKAVKSSLITLFLIIAVLQHLIMRFASFTDIYPSLLLYSVLFSIIILNYFNQLYKIGFTSTKMILIAFAVPIILYNLNFFIGDIYYHYTDTGRKEMERILPPPGFVQPSGSGIGSMLSAYKSPLDYSFFDSLSQKKAYRMVSYYLGEMYFLILLEVLTFPIVLLTFFSRYQVFKNLSLKPIVSVIYPFNYFALIEKFELPKVWKFYLFLPILNVIFMYKINVQVTNLYNLPKSNVWGLLFLPFIYYPKLAFDNKNSNEAAL
jgi:hypothetical protein